MKLSSIKTADQLILALASAGYRKEVPKGNLQVEEEPGPYFMYGFFPAADPIPTISIYPQILDHGSDLFICAYISRTEGIKGRIFSWDMVECFAGTSQPFTPTAETTSPESIGQTLQIWQNDVPPFARSRY